MVAQRCSGTISQYLGQIFEISLILVLEVSRSFLQCGAAASLVFECSALGLLVHLWFVMGE